MPNFDFCCIKLLPGGSPLFCVLSVVHYVIHWHDFVGDADSNRVGRCMSTFFLLTFYPSFILPYLCYSLK